MKTHIKGKYLMGCVAAVLLLLQTACKKAKEPETVYTVTVISNGGTNIAPIKVLSGEKLPKNKLYPNPIVSDGGTFISWYEDADYVKEFDFDAPVTKDMTIHAKWFYNTFKVSYAMNGAPARPEKEIVQGRKLTFERPVYDGFVFVNWFEDAGFTKPFNFNQPVNADVTLYARWVAPSPASWFSIDANGVLVGCSAPAGTAVVVVPEGVKVIPAWFVLANGLNEPGKPGFPTGKNIAEFILPESLESIGEGAFKYAAITSITIPSKVKVLEPVSFEGCGKLRSFNFAANSMMERLKGNDGNNPVIEAPLLESISFPPSTKLIGKYTMNGCTGLKLMTLERSESPVIFDSFLPGGGVWLFGGYFPQKIRMPSAIVDSFVSEMRKVMQDYEFDKMKGTIEGY